MTKPAEKPIPKVTNGHLKLKIVKELLCLRGANTP